MNEQINYVEWLWPKEIAELGNAFEKTAKEGPDGILRMKATDLGKVIFSNFLGKLL